MCKVRDGVSHWRDRVCPLILMFLYCASLTAVLWLKMFEIALLLPSWVGFSGAVLSMLVGGRHSTVASWPSGKVGAMLGLWVFSPS